MIAEHEKGPLLLQLLADRDLARWSSTASLSPFLLLVATVLFTPYLRDHRVLAASFVTYFGLLGLARRWWAGAFDWQYAGRPRRWRRGFAAGTVASALGWSAFVTVTILLYGERWTTWFVLLLTAGIAAGATVSLSPNLGLLRAYLLLMLFPPGLTCAWHGTPEGHAFAVVIVLFLIFMTHQSRNLSQRFWQAMVDRSMVHEQSEELQRRSEYLNALIENSPLAIVALDVAGHICLCNPAFERLFQFTSREVLGKNLDGLLASAETGHEPADLTSRTLAGETIHSTARRRRKDGTHVDVEIHAVPLMISGQRVGLYALYEDITDRKRAEAELAAAREALREQALRDPLTGVWNRRGIFDLLEKEMSRVRRTGSSLAVFLLDLDHFKKINDTYGHVAGDQVLAHTAKRLQNLLRGSDALGRYGGEEFLVLAPDCDADGAIRMAERICQSVATRPVPIPACEIQVTTSVGCALATGSMEAADLVHSADCALYRAKSSGRNRFEIAAPLSAANPVPASSG